MKEAPIEKQVDPRVRRTQQLLQQALTKLLDTTEFEKISVQSIAETATVNRATFYAHYEDKFALLECCIAGQFGELLKARKVRFEGGCDGELAAIWLALCDFLQTMPGVGLEGRRQMEPHVESALVAVVRQILWEGLMRHSEHRQMSCEMIASTVSWATLGAAKEWLRSGDEKPVEQTAQAVSALIAPLFGRSPSNC